MPKRDARHSFLLKEGQLTHPILPQNPPLQSASSYSGKVVIYMHIKALLEIYPEFYEVKLNPIAIMGKLYNDLYCIGFYFSHPTQLLQ